MPQAPIRYAGRQQLAGLCLCLALTALATPCRAASPQPVTITKAGQPVAWGHCLICPDDYCPKPWPCVPAAVCHGYCDDYCRKPLPALPCPVGGCYCDDYCPKPLPCVTPLHGAWLKCPLPFCKAQP